MESVLLFDFADRLPIAYRFKTIENFEARVMYDLVGRGVAVGACFLEPASHVLY